MEFVYVVPREKLFPDFFPQGLLPFGREFPCARFEAAARDHGFFVERAYAERSPSLKQIIPYAVVFRGAEVLLLRRSQKGGEARLFDKLSIGVGGHVNPIDAEHAQGAAEAGVGRSPDGTRGARARRVARIGSGDPTARQHEDLLLAATHREINEELSIRGGYSVESFGILNDDSNAVGAVHVGLVQRVDVDGALEVREKDQLDGRLVPHSELCTLLAEGANFESWSGLLVARLDELVPRAAPPAERALFIP